MPGSAAGRTHEAADHLQRRWPGTTQCSDGVDDVLWTITRARVYERIGRSVEAIADYTLVADAWRNADPELQPFVTEAKDAIKRLKASR